ncbi:MAG: hypothetical protein ACI97R_002056 [Candidatus Azotimanducaceae bacterium]|jgi:hypothetical protein
MWSKTRSLNFNLLSFAAWYSEETRYSVIKLAPKTHIAITVVVDDSEYLRSNTMDPTMLARNPAP